MISSWVLIPTNVKLCSNKLIPSEGKTNSLLKYLRVCAEIWILLKLIKNSEFAKNIFVFGQCMEGTQFYGLFGMILSLARQNKFPGVGQMFRYTLRDESNTLNYFVTFSEF